jgi:hypothetical protein
MSDIAKYQNKFKIILVLGVFAGLVGFVHIAPFVYADKNNLDASSGLSTDIHVGKSEIGANSSSDESASEHYTGSGMSGTVSSDTNASVTARSQNDSHENSHATSSESESHEHYKDKYDKMSASSDDEFTVQSERHLYKPGDNVTIDGSLWSSLISSLGNVSTVSIQVADNDGKIVYSGNGTINANGDYSAAFVLPSDAKNGAYAVNVNADVSSDVLDTLSLKAKSGLSSSTKIVVVNPNAIKIKSEGRDFDVEVASNSTTLDNLNFDAQNKKLSFTVQGDTGTKGVTQITIPKSLLNGDLTVMIDGHAMAQTDVVETANTDTETTLELNYHHSTHQIDIVGTNAIPEFSTVASLVLVVSLISMIVLSQIRRL